MPDEILKSIKENFIIYLIRVLYMDVILKFIKRGHPFEVFKKKSKIFRLCFVIAYLIMSRKETENRFFEIIIDKKRKKSGKYAAATNCLQNKF